jgi:hypothetical protein
MGWSVKDRELQDGSTAETVMGGPAPHLQPENPLAERDRIFGNSPRQTEHIGVHPTTSRRPRSPIAPPRSPRYQRPRRKKESISENPVAV